MSKENIKKINENVVIPPEKDLIFADAVELLKMMDNNEVERITALHIAFKLGYSMSKDN